MKTNKKIIYALLSLLIVILFGYILQHKNSSQEQDYYGTVADIDMQEKIGLSNYELQTNSDSTTLHFPKTKIGDVYVEKTITYNKDGSGEIVLELEGDGEYVEIIPKSFAKHVDDIEFSVEPDEIINEDPIVKWMIDTIKNRITKIVIKVKKVAYKEGKKTGESQGFTGFRDSILSGEFNFSKIKKEAKKAGLEAGIKAGANEMINHLEDFVFISDLSICVSKKGKEAQYNCLMLLVSKHPSWFDCNEMFSEKNHPYVARLSCEAIKNDDINICDKEYRDYDPENPETGLTVCQRHFFKIKALTCNNLPENEKALCIIELIREIEYKECCNEFPMDIEKCSTKNKKETDNKEHEEKETDNKDSAVEKFDCPIPAGAIHEVTSYKDIWKDSDGKTVGLYLRYYDYKRKIIASALCYNAEGKGHGISKSWNKDGTLKKDCLYENGVKISCEEIKEAVDNTPFVPIGSKACAEREKNCKGMNPLDSYASTEIPTVSCRCINNKIITCNDKQCSEMTEEKKKLICLSFRDRCSNPILDQGVMWEYGFKCECIGNVIVSCTDGMCE
ncbi:hypothetical protein KAI92_03980 [Candidatus Parcubacteria bacterium]|nr:hypothetical protein [Candidatus Parcubacteria bacterium]